MIEIPFTAKKVNDDPFNKVSLDVVFTNPDNKTLRVPAFWDGGSKWKVRYASPVVGTHHFISECSDREDQGLHNVTGEVCINAYTGENPLYKHGPVRVAADRRYLQYADGTPFFWLGDTWWMGLCHRLHWPDEVKTLAADRKAKGFNVIQIVAGLYPDMPPFDPRGANEAGFPWEEKYARIRPEYFDAADQRLEYLVDQGFSPCIVGAWGYFMPLDGRRQGQATLAIPDREVRRVTRRVVRRGRGESAVVSGQRVSIRRSETDVAVDGGDAIHPHNGSLPPTPDDPSDRHRPPVGPKRDRRSGLTRYRHAANPARAA